MENPMYRYSTSSTAFGKTHCFMGPGLSRYCNDIHLIQMNPPPDWPINEDRIAGDAQHILTMLHGAYAAGYKAAKKDIRVMLGIDD